MSVHILIILFCHVKVKKKNKETTVGVPRTTSSQHSVKKSKKITKDEKLKKNIKAAALSIAKLKKKKKILQVSQIVIP